MSLSVTAYEFALLLWYWMSGLFYAVVDVYFPDSIMPLDSADQLIKDERHLKSEAGGMLKLVKAQEAQPDQQETTVKLRFAFVMCEHNSADTRDVRNNFFISVRFRFGFLEKNFGFGSEWVGSVRFKKTRFGSNIIVIYYSCKSKYYSNSGWHDFDVTHNNDSK